MIKAERLSLPTAVVVIVLLVPHWAWASTVAVDSDEQSVTITADDDTDHTVQLQASTTDVQALMVTRGETTYAVIAVAENNIIRLKLYSLTGELLATETVVDLADSKTLTVFRMTYKKKSSPEVIQIQTISTNDQGKPKKVLKKQYSLKPNNDSPFKLESSTNQRITFSSEYYEAGDDHGLDLFNWERMSAGLLPIKTKTDITERCALHAEYMRLNDEVTHYEKIYKPGYTTDGAEAGLQSNTTSQYNTNFANGVDILTAAIYHRIPMLRNNLFATGWGVSDLSKQGYRYGCLTVYARNGWYFTDSTLSTDEVYMTAFNPDNHDPIPYPGLGQQHIPIDFITGESPDPLAEFGGTYPAGFPISLTFAWYDKVEKSSMKLYDEQDKTVPGYFRAPHDPTDPNAEEQQNAVIFIPEAPLAYDTTYTVKVSAQVNDDDYAKQWHFTTEDHDQNHPYAK